MTTYFPEIIKGKERKSSFWEVRDRYNKFYTMADAPDVESGFLSPTYADLVIGMPDVTPSALAGTCRMHAN